MSETSSKKLDGFIECSECVETLTKLARRRVYIVSENLESELYNARSIYDHLVEMAGSNRKTDIRLLAHDTRAATNNKHYLTRLAQKLPSFAQVRMMTNAAHKGFNQSWLIVDDRAFMRLVYPLRYEGYFDTDNRLECKSLAEAFIDMWEASELDQNSRRLNL